MHRAQCQASRTQASQHSPKPVVHLQPTNETSVIKVVQRQRTASHRRLGVARTWHSTTNLGLDDIDTIRFSVDVDTIASTELPFEVECTSISSKSSERASEREIDNATTSMRTTVALCTRIKHIAYLPQFAVGHDGNAITQSIGLLHTMRGQHYNAVVSQVFDRIPHVAAISRVHSSSLESRTASENCATTPITNTVCTYRLVQEEDLGVADGCQCEAQASFHATTERGRKVVGIRQQSHALKFVFQLRTRVSSR
jgi:hypothetical protein